MQGVHCVVSHWLREQFRPQGSTFTIVFAKPFVLFVIFCRWIFLPMLSPLNFGCGLEYSRRDVLVVVLETDRERRNCLANKCKPTWSNRLKVTLIRQFCCNKKNKNKHVYLSENVRIFNFWYLCHPFMWRDGATALKKIRSFKEQLP